MAGPVEPVVYPMMWARDASTSFLRPPAEMRALIERAGFRVLVWDDITELTAGPASGAAIPPQKWGITVHGSHYGLVQDNVVFNLGGAGIVTEDGSESFNVFDHNFVAKIGSNGGRDEHEDQPRGIAREGVGFWFRGPNNQIRNNVAANLGENGGDVEASYGYKYNMVYLGTVRVPAFRGADTWVAGQHSSRNGNQMPLLEFDNNEVYGVVQGLTMWWLCSLSGGDEYRGQCGQSVIRNLVVWHAMRYAYYGYPGYNYVFDNAKVYGDARYIGQGHELTLALPDGALQATDAPRLREQFEHLETMRVGQGFPEAGELAVQTVFERSMGIVHCQVFNIILE